MYIYIYIYYIYIPLHIAVFVHLHHTESHSWPLSPVCSAPLRRTSEKLGQVASQLLRQLPMVSASSERALLSELERCQSDVAVNFVQKVWPGDLVEEMLFFWTTSSFFSNNLFVFHFLVECCFVVVFFLCFFALVGVGSVFHWMISWMVSFSYPNLQVQSSTKNTMPTRVALLTEPWTNHRCNDQYPEKLRAGTQRSFPFCGEFLSQEGLQFVAERCV